LGFQAFFWKARKRKINPVDPVNPVQKYFKEKSNPFLNNIVGLGSNLSQKGT